MRGTNQVKDIPSDRERRRTSDFLGCCRDVTLLAAILQDDLHVEVLSSVLKGMLAELGEIVDGTVPAR